MKSLLKKISVGGLIACTLFSFIFFSSCSAKKTDTSGKLKVICTIFPEYDWFMNVAGQEIQKIIPSLLIKSGVDLHNFQPSTKDMIDISECDLLIYVGGESDGWIKKALLNSTNPNQKVINLMEVLKENIKEEELVEGMQEEEEHHHDESEDHDEDEEHHDEGEEHEESEHHHHEEIEYDEHVWLSLKNAETYKANAKNYILELKDLDGQYKEALKNPSEKPLIFCDRFPFRYMTDDYALSYYAAFKGCSTESEASFETIVFLADKVRENDSAYVIKIDNSSEKLADTVIATAKKPSCRIITLDSMQSTTLEDIFKGKTYIGTMKANLEELKKVIQ